jgi:hypothetical protein
MTSNQETYIEAYDDKVVPGVAREVVEIAENAYNGADTKLREMDVIGLIEDVKSVTYQTFDQISFRRMMIENVKLEDVTSTTAFIKIVIRCFIAFSRSGTNLTVISKKAADPKRAQEIITELTNFGIKMKAIESNSKTLSRITSVFLGAYLGFRVATRSDLQNQGGSIVAVEYQDISFCASKLIWNTAGYQDYYWGFSKLISKKDPERLKSVIAKDHRFVNLSQNGFVDDVVNRTMFDKIFVDRCADLVDVGKIIIAYIRMERLMMESEEINENDIEVDL